MTSLLLLPASGAAADGVFRERARELGVDFVHDFFGSGHKYMPENMAPGVVVFDFDGDGLLDIYLVQSAPIGPDVGPGTETNRLFRQTLEGRFEDVTERAGVGDSGYGMGATFGDYDRDGDLDLYVSNYGPNVLLRNESRRRLVRVGSGCRRGGLPVVEHRRRLLRPRRRRRSRPVRRQLRRLQLRQRRLVRQRPARRARLLPPGRLRGVARLLLPQRGRRDVHRRQR